MSGFDPTICLLFDNGSLNAATTLSLRRLARAVAADLGVEVKPVSLLHSSGVSTAELGGEPAQLLEPALLEFGAEGGRRAVALPLFFGPSRALTDYVPERLQAIRERCPHLEVRLAAPLVSGRDDAAGWMGRAIAERVRDVAAGGQLRHPAVILCDHGSPVAAVAAVRDQIAAALASELKEGFGAVRAASMERRPGPEFAFNEPLLESALDAAAAAGATEVVVALQFFQPGRHAGPGGDIAQICAAVREKHPALRTFFTDPIVDAPEVRALLQRRYREACATGQA